MKNRYWQNRRNKWHNERSKYQWQTKLKRKHTHPSFVGGINIKYGKIYELEHKPNAIDGDDQDAVRVHEGEPIEHPKRTVQHSRYVRIRFELLHRLLIDNSIECWAENFIEITQKRIKKLKILKSKILKKEEEEEKTVCY